MSIAERKEREKEELKNRILNAAAEIVSEAGHNNLKIRAIAEKIEYSPRTIYLYYPDKAALLEAVIEKGFEFTVSQMNEIDLQKSILPEKILKTMITNHVKMAFSNPNYYRAVITLSMDKEFQPGIYQSKVISGVGQLINLYFSQFKKEQEDIKLITAIVMDSLRGFTLKLINSDEKMDHIIIEKKLEIFTKFIFDGLKEY